MKYTNQKQKELLEASGQLVLSNAQDAFQVYFDHILSKGVKIQDTKAIFNTGFYIFNPEDNHINTKWRKWSLKYANIEWDWYLNGDLDPEPVVKMAKIWESCKDENGLVRSNYGYQWRRGDQLNKVVDILKNDPDSRKAAISLYDGKEIDSYKYDTICTYAIHFSIQDKYLNMSVMMRSNDLVYGFCNDQYCFSNLQILIANKLDKEVGWYYHFVNNFHIYKRHFDLNI